MLVRFKETTGLNPGTRGKDFDPSHRGPDKLEPPQATPPKFEWPKQQPDPEFVPEPLPESAQSVSISGPNRLASS
jgi:hypothetical protein